MRERALALLPQAAFEEPEAIRTVLAEHAPCARFQAGVGGTFSRMPTPDEYSDVTMQDGCFVVLADRRPVSWAWTQDGSARAAELAVETSPEYRRRGFARQVVAAWAAHELSAGRVAFYSYFTGNEASAALARSLGVTLYAEWVAFVAAASPAATT